MPNNLYTQHPTPVGLSDVAVKRAIDATTRLEHFRRINQG